MEQLLVEIAKQTPSLGVLCFIVWIFIKHLDKRAETLTEMHKEHIYAREQTRMAISENSQVMRDNNEVTKDLKTGLDDLKNVIQNKLTSSHR